MTLNRTQRLALWIEKNPNFFRATLAFFFILVLWSFITAAFFLYAIHHPNSISTTAADVFAGFELTFAFIFGAFGGFLVYKANEKTLQAREKYGNHPDQQSHHVDEDESEDEDAAPHSRPMMMKMPERETVSQPIQFSNRISSGSRSVGGQADASSAASSLL